jgi:hypothetical protein
MQGQPGGERLFKIADGRASRSLPHVWCAGLTLPTDLLVISPPGSHPAIRPACHGTRKGKAQGRTTNEHPQRALMLPNPSGGQMECIMRSLRGQSEGSTESASLGDGKARKRGRCEISCDSIIRWGFSHGSALLGSETPAAVQLDSWSCVCGGRVVGRVVGRGRGGGLFCRKRQFFAKAE